MANLRAQAEIEPDNADEVISLAKALEIALPERMTASEKALLGVALDPHYATQPVGEMAEAAGISDRHARRILLKPAFAQARRSALALYLQSRIGPALEAMLSVAASEDTRAWQDRRQLFEMAGLAETRRKQAGDDGRQAPLRIFINPGQDGQETALAARVAAPRARNADE